MESVVFYSVSSFTITALPGYIASLFLWGDLDVMIRSHIAFLVVFQLTWLVAAAWSAACFLSL